MIDDATPHTAGLSGPSSTAKSVRAHERRGKPGSVKSQRLPEKTGGGGMSLTPGRLPQLLLPSERSEYP